MIKVKIYELEKHRNETTFRPYLAAMDLLNDIGIELTDGDSYDLAWIGQASIIDKMLPLSESVARGVEFMHSVTGDSIIFDGQDSHSLIGTVEVFKELRISSMGRCLLLMKNTLLRDFEMYKIPSVNGRLYWGDGEYSVPDIDLISDQIVLSGTNWLSTINNMNFYPVNQFNKHYDVGAMFGNSLTKGEEHGLQHHKHYNMHRERCMNVLKNLKGVNCNMLTDGERVSANDYYNRMAASKIVVAPFGYGEMAPRDLETMAFGSILIKPSMDHLISEPWIYDEGQTYIGCRHDFADLEEKIGFVLDNFTWLQKEMYDYSLKKYLAQYNDPTRLPMYLHKLFSEKLNKIIAYD